MHRRDLCLWLVLLAQAFSASAQVLNIEKDRVQLAEMDGLWRFHTGAKDGQLFGFERSRAISNQSAQKIAQAAQSFGQEDDITVLTLSRVAIPLSV